MSIIPPLGGKDCSGTSPLSTCNSEQLIRGSGRLSTVLEDSPISKREKRRILYGKFVWQTLVRQVGRQMVVCKRIEIERKPSTTYDKVCRLKRLITTKHVRYNVETKIPSALTNFNGCTDVLCCHIHEQSLSRLRLNKLDGCKWLSSASCPRTVSKYQIIKEREKKKGGQTRAWQ